MSRRRRLAILLVLAVQPALADLPLFKRGHLKGQAQQTRYPEDSLLRGPLGAVASDQGTALRLNFRGDVERFSLAADYQLLGRFGDSLALAELIAAPLPLPPPLPDDEQRLWDLSDTVSEGQDHLVVQRLDRLHLDYTGERTVVRLGRQAVSWGNGLIYNPMDFFNPFDPAAVDTEYKIGDDMLYGQYLLDSGSDWQLVHVRRRDTAGEASAEVSSTALKYHGFGLEREYDLLLAEHFDNLVLALGGTTNAGGAVLRGDLVMTDTAHGWEASLVANWSWSWTWRGYNVSAVAEYFFNGFGLRESDYTAAKIAEADELTARIARGELFTLGRHYAAGSLQVEVTPLLNLTPNLFINLGDGSALCQLVVRWDLHENWQLLAAANLPLGPDGTEYGGIETGLEGQRLGAGPSAFAQLAFYF